MDGGGDEFELFSPGRRNFLDGKGIIVLISSNHLLLTNCALLYNTRLETRTKESRIIASFRVEQTLGRSENERLSEVTFLWERGNAQASPEVL
jgi:hypothetical protein